MVEALCERMWVHPSGRHSLMTERSIFLAALDRPDPAERAAYLDQACAGDAELRRRVEDLLEAHDEPGDFLEPPADRRRHRPVWR